MKKIDKHIEIVHTANAQINTMGYKSCKLIQSALLKLYTSVEISQVNELFELEQIVSRRPDLVFLGLKRLPREGGFGDESMRSIWLSEYLDQHGIVYTGSSRGAIQLAINKYNAKSLISLAGLPTADYFKAAPGEYLTASQLPLQFPLFVKPISSGGSKGIDADSVVRNFEEFQYKIAAIFERFGTSSLVEQYLEGREFSIALLGGPDGGKLTAMPIEIIPEANVCGDKILGRDVKKADTELVLPVVNSKLRDQLCDLAKNIFETLGARDFGRVDVRMDAHNNPYFLEANLIPGLSGGYFTRACKFNQNMDYEDMIIRISKLALTRTADIQDIVVV